MADITLRSFTLNQGEAFSRGISVVDADGAAVDITGATIDLVTQYGGNIEETDGSTGDWMRAAINSGADGIDFSLTAAQTEALEVGKYVTFCNIAYGGNEPDKVAEFTIEIIEEEEATVPINKDNVLLRCSLTSSDINEDELDLAVDSAVAIVQATIPSKVWAWCSIYGYPRHVAVLAEEYATLKFKGMVWPDKVDEQREDMKAIEALLRNVSIDKDGDKIEDDSAGGTVDIIMS